MYFLAGTDTDAGKTYFGCLLLRQFAARGIAMAPFKPVGCGPRTDAEELLRASGLPLTLDEVNPTAFATPAAPMVAAWREELQFDRAKVLGGFGALREKYNHVLVESAGGWMTPMTAEYSVADLAVDLKLPVVLLAPNRLGVLSSIAVVRDSILERGLELRCIVLSDCGPRDSDDIAAETNLEAARAICRETPVFALAHESTELPSEIAAVLGGA